MFEQGFDRFRAFMMGGKLEMPEADMALGYPNQRGGGFNGFPADRVPGAYHEQGPGGGNAQAMHGLTAQVLAYGGAQHRPAIAEAGVRRHAGALQVPVPAAAIRPGGFPEQKPPAVPQVGVVNAELVPGVFHRHRVHTLKQFRTCAHGGPVGFRLGVEAHLLGELVVEAHHPGVLQGRWLDARVKAVREFQVAMLHAKFVATHKMPILPLV